MAWKLHSVAHLEGLLRVPVSLEFVTQCLLQFLAEYVDTSSRQFVVQIRDDKIQGHLYFNMHFDRCRFRSLTHYIHSHSHTRTHTNCLARLRSFRTLSLSLSLVLLVLLSRSFGYNFLLSLGWICGGWWVEGELSWQRYASTFISLYALHNVPLCLQFWILLSKSLAYCFSAVYIHMYTYIYCLYICLYMHIYISIYIYTYIESSIYIYIYISPPPSLTSSSFVSDDCFAVSVFFLFFLFFLFFCLILNMWCSMLCSARFYSIMFFELFLCIEWELCFSPSDWVFPFQMTL